MNIMKNISEVIVGLSGQKATRRSVLTTPFTSRAKSMNMIVICRWTRQTIVYTILVNVSTLMHLFSGYFRLIGINSTSLLIAIIQQVT